jgi:hypothetical protein
MMRKFVLRKNMERPCCFGGDPELAQWVANHQTLQSATPVPIPVKKPVPPVPVREVVRG